MNLIPFVSLSPTLLFVAILKAPPPALLSITMLMGCALQGLPDWAQAEVEQQIRAIAGGHLTPAHAAILTRLMTDPRMSKVWKVLSRRSPELPDDEKEAKVSNEQIWGSAEITREDSDEIVKAKLEETKRKFERQRRQDIQAEAIAWVIPLTFRIVVYPEYFAVIKPKDIKDVREGLRHDADELCRMAERPSVHAEALRQQAASLREEAARPWPDPYLVIRRDRNPKGVKIDRTTKGVQIRIAKLLETRFGTTGRTAATLAEVALGLEPGALSERTARSALKPGETAH